MTITAQPENDRFDWPAEHARIIDEYRRNGGVVDGRFAGDNLLILQTTGARTGLPRFTVLSYVAEGNRYYIINGTAAYGVTRKPDWSYNIAAEPRVAVEVGVERFPAVARELTGDEREGIWPRFEARLPHIARFAQETNYLFPIFELTRTAA